MSEKPTPPFDGHDHMSPPGLESELSPAPRYKAPKYKGSGKLEGKVALITGGDSGIGRAVAVLFAREGASVAILALKEEKSDAEETIKAIENEGTKGLALYGDVTSWESCEQTVSKVVEHFGGLDILVNNAAFQNHVDKVEEVSLEQWDRTFKTNIYGYFHMVKAALPHLGKGSVILNTGSVTGVEGAKGLLDYAATKGAIHAFTKTLAQMLVKKKIRVNCVAPGPVWTPLNPAEREPEEVRTFGEDSPMGRPAQPEELAPSYVFLASNADSSYITGEVLHVFGGDTTAG